jgi:hypothetical protein
MPVVVRDAVATFAGAGIRFHHASDHAASHFDLRADHAILQFKESLHDPKLALRPLLLLSTSPGKA